MINILLLFLLPSLFLSCGKKPNSSDERREEEVVSEGTFAAVFFPVNRKITSSFNGEILVMRYGDEFKVNLNITAAPPGIHKQYIHAGSSCPRLDADRNHDGYIDEDEALDFMGPKLIPLDGDISSQRLGSEYFPSGTRYRYTRSTSYYLMLSDLQLPDDDITDSIVKLGNEELILEERAVSIYGMGPAGEMPIACGILTRIFTAPEDDTWNEPPPSRPGPRPSPRPSPSPDLEIEPEVDTEYTSWWQRMRQRWSRWRERAGGWWRRDSD